MKTLSLLKYGSVFRDHFINGVSFIDSFCFLAALCGVFGSLCLNRGLQLEKAAPAALMRNVDILLAFVFDFAIFGQQPRVLTLLGGLLVMLSTGGVALAKWWRSRNSL